MNGSNARIPLIVMLAFIGALLLGALFFLTGMQSSSYVVSDGVQYTLQFMDKPRYDRNLMGLIYTGVFLLAGLLLLLMLAMPDERALAAMRRAASAPPQPRRRRPQAGAAPGAPAPAAAPQPPPAEPEAPPPEAEAAPAAEPGPPPQEPEAPGAPPAGTVLALEGEQAAQAAAAQESLAQPPPKAPPKPAAPEVPVDVAAQQDAAMEPTDLPASGPELSGEEDVVYGDGPVTEQSIFEFIQNYPDSAVKFLYRKNLDNRSLPPVEEDIYQRWERRGMTRSKVRQLVLELMDWERLPDDFPHVIWLRLRDRIYELRTQVHA